MSFYTSRSLDVVAHCACFARFKTCDSVGPDRSDVTPHLASQFLPANTSDSLIVTPSVTVLRALMASPAKRDASGARVRLYNDRSQQARHQVDGHNNSDGSHMLNR